MSDTPTPTAPVVTPTPANVGELLTGAMLPAPGGSYAAPGWKCRLCEWTAPALGYAIPPPHRCAGALAAALAAELAELRARHNGQTTEPQPEPTGAA